MNREESTEVVVVWTTFPGDNDPALFAETLVSERLAACVTIQRGLTSIYRWRDGIEKAGEYQLTIKTRADRLGDLERRIGELHPYDVPEFLILPINGGAAAYLEYVRASTEPE